jgi:hypothetical protein
MRNFVSYQLFQQWRGQIDDDDGDQNQFYQDWCPKPTEGCIVSPRCHKCTNNLSSGVNSNSDQAWHIFS